MKFKDLEPIKSMYEVKKRSVMRMFDGVVEHTPIYHYTSGEALKNIIENNELWLTDSRFLNDKREIEHTKNMVQIIIDECMTLNKECFYVEDRFKDIVLEVLDELTYNMYILSLSTNKDSAFLWSNYSNNEGYSIKFMADEIYKHIVCYTCTQQEKILFPIAGKVIYNEEEQKERLTQIVLTLYQIYLYYINEKKIDFFNDEVREIAAILMGCMIMYKKNVFSQEDEYRIAVIDLSGKFEDVSFRFNKGAIIPYIKVPIIQKKDVKYNQKLEEGIDVERLRESAIEGIGIGPKNNIDIAQMGMEIFLKSRKIEKNIKVEQSGIPYRY